MSIPNNKSKQLKELGQILSSSKYNEQNTDRKIRLITFKKHFSDQDDYCQVTKDVKDSYIVFIPTTDDKHTIYFLHLLFDSSIGRVFLSTLATNKIGGNVTLKLLREFPVLDVSDDIIKAGAILDLSIKTIVQIMQEKEDLELLESVRSLMQEIRDAFILELYSKPFFENNNINIVKPLVEIIDGIDSTKLNLVVPKLLKAIINPNGELLGNIRRLRVLIGNIFDKIKSNK